MFYQIFVSPQVKRWAIITYKHGVYELPHELRNDFRLRILGNKEISGKCLVRSLPAKMEVLLILAENCSRGALFHLKNRVSLKSFVSYCRFNKINGFIRVRGGEFRHLVLFDYELFDEIILIRLNIL